MNTYQLWESDHDPKTLEITLINKADLEAQYPLMGQSPRLVKEFHARDDEHAEHIRNQHYGWEK